MRGADDARVARLVELTRRQGEIDFETLLIAAERRKLISVLVDDGYSQRALAAFAGLSRGRVHAIVKEIRGTS